MHIRVKLYSTLVPYVPNVRPGIPFDVELDDGSVLTDVVKRLKLPRKQIQTAFVNGSAQPLNYRLQNDDELGIFPPIGGG
jgi:molybdopterin converting factor small subunit